jgi:hypothetical protein
MSKNFDEFRTSLTEEDIAETVDNAKSLLEPITKDRQGLGNQVTAISLGINLGMLERYHAWLHSSPDKQNLKN